MNNIKINPEFDLDQKLADFKNHFMAHTKTMPAEELAIGAFFIGASSVVQIVHAMGNEMERQYDPDLNITVQKKLQASIENGLYPFAAKTARHIFAEALKDVTD
jgi:hypothetical protein